MGLRFSLVLRPAPWGHLQGQLRPAPEGVPLACGSLSLRTSALTPSAHRPFSPASRLQFRRVSVNNASVSRIVVLRSCELRRTSPPLRQQWSECLSFAVQESGKAWEAAHELVVSQYHPCRSGHHIVCLEFMRESVTPIRAPSSGISLGALSAT